VSADRRTLLFAPAAYNLAETTRMLQIAKGVRDHERAGAVFEIHFVSEGGEFEQLIEDEGFPLERIEPRITDAKIAYILAVNDEQKLGTVYSTEEMVAKVYCDVAYLRRLQPAAVVTGSYLSMPVSCQVAEVPLVWTIQSTWLEQFFASGAGVTDGVPHPLRRLADAAVCTVIRSWMWYGFIRPVNAAAKRFGVTPYRPVFDYFRGDLTLVAEPAEFSGMALPADHRYIGPLLADEDFEVPEEVRTIPRDRPVVYFAMGSSGVPDLVVEILESFRDQPWRVIAPVRPLLRSRPDVAVPANVVMTDWLPALEISRTADVSVIHGGIGTVMTAALAGKPVVGVGMQAEQRANLACLERRGTAIRLPKSRDLPRRVQQAIRTQLADDDAQRRAREFSKVVAEWDGPRMAAEALLERYA
jgi:UDP:flavonoid glycosyltransferase YjiC (YdhE family)